MTDSYFSNDDTIPNDVFDESLVSDEEDDDYNAFNNETFGDDSWGGDWEEDHEKMAEIAELSRHHFDNDDDDSELSNKIANFILDDDDVIKNNSGFLCELLDDEYNDDDFQRVPNTLHFTSSVVLPIQSNLMNNRQEDHSQQQVRPKTRPPPGFVDNQPPFLLPSEQPNPPNIKNICTVEEIERSLRKPPPTSVRLEDLERILISSVAMNNVMLRSGIVRGMARVPAARPASLQPGARLVTPTPPRPQSMNILPPFLPPHPLLMQLQQNNRTLLPPLPAQLQNVANLQPAMPINSQSNVDPYDGLMTYKEKQWVASIQIMQISANPTYQNDYYYIMYQHRQSGGRKINALKNQRDSGNNLNKHQYTPQQFENSLGKIQAGSVTAPRKIIDMDIVEKSSLDSPTSQQSSSSKKFKQILLEIEQMYADVLKAEEAISPLLPVPPDPNVDPKALFMKTVNTLLKKDNLSTILNIRKGKALVVRVMSHPEVCSELAKSLLGLLPGIAVADCDQALLRALPSVRHYLQSTTPEQIENLAKFLQNDLNFLLFNKFGISVIANVLERGETLDLGTEDWCQFLSSLGSCLSKETTNEPQRPVVGVPGPALSRLLSRAYPPLSSSQITLLTRSLATLNSLQS